MRWKRLASFMTSKWCMRTGLVILTIISLLAVFADQLSPYDPNAVTGRSLEPPSSRHLLGTDDAGRDILSELLHGSRVTLTVGFTAALISVLLGTLIGATAGYIGGLVDEVLMRFTDAWLSIPPLLFAVFMVSSLSIRGGVNSIVSIILAIALTSWPGVARVVRACVLSLREAQYVEAARALGCSEARILFVHILPTMTPLIVAEVATRVAVAMIAEASLSFLGVGDPSIVSWGSMMRFALLRNAIVLGYWWWFLPPGIMISLAVLGVILVGMGLEEYINPKITMARVQYRNSD